ncbi:hypothetical protein [Paenibacillus sp. IHBB 10380]|uniref:hypothetical protein n=1 Tax=Paenibacillus sp. IHBB 10380 TaxID=1566358 RepID=UPI0005CFA220|nr:hypothetical protein [Paenibacillus sp. IHBB 10380]AJS58277.1 hypothetical protein UB51_06955 [Paenibacillus sp. IHBB 10380]
MKKGYIYSLAIVFLVNLILIFLVDLFTIKMSPSGHISGNGNLGIILWFFEIPLFLVFLLLFIFWKNIKFINFISSGYTLGVDVILLIVTIRLQYVFANGIYTKIAGKIDTYGTVNQYTNTIFINYYTFFIGVISTLFIMGVFWKINKRQDRLSNLTS